MGLHISLYNSKSQDHPEWDFGRMEGDEEFASLVGRSMDMFPLLERGTIESPLYRPADFGKWREGIHLSSVPNKNRFLNLLSILERDTDYWIHFGY